MLPFYVYVARLHTNHGVDSLRLSVEPNYTTNLMNERASKYSGPYMSIYKPRSMPCGGFCERSKEASRSHFTGLTCWWRVNAHSALSETLETLGRITDRLRFYRGPDAVLSRRETLLAVRRTNTPFFPSRATTLKSARTPPAREPF